MTTIDLGNKIYWHNNHEAEAYKTFSQDGITSSEITKPFRDTDCSHTHYQTAKVVTVGSVALGFAYYLANDWRFIVVSTLLTGAGALLLTKVREVHNHNLAVCDKLLTEYNAAKKDK